MIKNGIFKQFRERRKKAATKCRSNDPETEEQRFAGCSLLREPDWEYDDEFEVPGPRTIATTKTNLEIFKDSKLDHSHPHPDDRDGSYFKRVQKPIEEPIGPRTTKRTTSLTPIVTHSSDQSCDSTDSRLLMERRMHRSEILKLKKRFTVEIQLLRSEIRSFPINFRLDYDDTEVRKIKDRLGVGYRLAYDSYQGSSSSFVSDAGTYPRIRDSNFGTEKDLGHESGCPLSPNFGEMYDSLTTLTTREDTSNVDKSREPPDRIAQLSDNSRMTPAPIPKSMDLRRMPNVNQLISKQTTLMKRNGGSDNSAAWRSLLRTGIRDVRKMNRDLDEALAIERNIMIDLDLSRKILRCRKHFVRDEIEDLENFWKRENDNLKSGYDSKIEGLNKTYNDNLETIDLQFKEIIRIMTDKLIVTKEQWVESETSYQVELSNSLEMVNNVTKEFNEILRKQLKSP